MAKNEKKDSEDTQRQQALERTMSQIEKQFGKGSIMKLGDGVVLDVPAISTGALSLDLALGVGGIPRGRVTEIYGREATGKSMLALQVTANAQKAGGIAAFIDAEHALDPDFSRRLGVDVDNLMVNQPDSGEQALEITEMLVRSNALDIITIDSVAALVPRTELEGEMGDAQMGAQARLMSQALRKLTAAINKSRTAVIFINQTREKIGVMFGNPETTPGGRALKFYSSVRIELRRVGSIKDGDRIVGNRVRAKIQKNKVAAPFKSAEFDILFESGISREGDVLDLAIGAQMVEKSGAWFSYGDIRLGQGRENARQFLKDNIDIMQELTEKLKEILLPHKVKKEAEPGKEEAKDA
ncbi:MAG: recombinase RecA [Planctomycetes bacterium]|nr:recombinase RecA [Planctomycetota bacterium]